MDRLILVSGDSHAVAPPELWPEYLDTEYHGYLPEMRADNEEHVQLRARFATVGPEAFKDRPQAMAVFNVMTAAAARLANN